MWNCCLLNLAIKKEDAHAAILLVRCNYAILDFKVMIRAIHTPQCTSRLHGAGNESPQTKLRDVNRNMLDILFIHIYKRAVTRGFASLNQESPRSALAPRL
uniref:Uncharacterized protein n=1 Tax=Bombyx mori TaxID=7091 RepID=A0A8R2R997_BOMMO|nr:uncharacterized protein LOC119630444 isoform X3 [Bombyx mori]XP_037875866.1 uncharacterized protein LOC119630444 isoform X3 [Bombyx mori]